MIGHKGDSRNEQPALSPYAAGAARQRIAPDHERPIARKVARTAPRHAKSAAPLAPTTYAVQSIGGRGALPVGLLSSQG